MNSIRTATDDPLEAVLASHVIAIVRERSADAAKREVDRLVDVGISVVEVSLATPDALDVVRWMTGRSYDRPLHFGVGTVLTDRDVDAAADAGASFVVSPISHRDLILACRRLGLMSVTGAFTPTECTQATQSGADLVKLFPASLWSLSSFRGLREALPFLKLVPTGGIDFADAAEWLAAGAVAVGMGGGLRDVRTAAELRLQLEGLADRDVVGSA